MTDLAVIIPCYNEALSIMDTLTQLKPAIVKLNQIYGPLDIGIWVYDNNSTDNTVEKTKEWSCLNKDINVSVNQCFEQSKGNVIRQAFMEIDARAYCMIDGDNTYGVESFTEMYEMIVNGRADMVTGDRLSTSYFTENKRRFHNFGNKLMKNSINKMFNKNYKDILSGFRMFSYRFVKTFPVLSEGFSIETEMNIHAAANKIPTVDIETEYHDRVAGSESKLQTIPDGIRVLKQLFMMIWLYKPLKFYGLISIILFIAGILFNAPVFVEYFETGLVKRFPTLIAGCFLMLTGITAFFVGQIQESDNVRQRQNFRIKFMEKDKECRKNER